ncbi:hypothetical protein GCM10009744_17540 [Kribbella alba]|uniref:Uncharacterized protein n=1 Tax=Kribbella alba TaxID=190197 RepID=A0ABP4R0F9_9ACTN
MSGSAGVTSDCNMENAATTVANTASVTRGEVVFLCLVSDMVMDMRKSFERV